jgi:putative acetyltransferase
MPTVIVRRSQPDDFEAWLSLFEEVAAEGRWIGREGTLDRDGRRRAFERALDSESAATFLAEDDNQLVGLLGVTLNAGVADLGMMVRDGHRGRGVGSALMDACLTWSREHAAHKVALTVWPHNERALVLYRKYGFCVEGRLTRHHRRLNGELWDAIPMGLVLDQTSPGSPFTDAPGPPDA